MSDVQKTVEFALKLTGISPAKLTPLVTGFEALRAKITEAQSAITEFQGSINKLKVPTSFATLSSNLDALGKVKIKDLTPLAESLTKISQISKMPPIGTFVNNIVTLSGTSLAGLSTLAKNLQAIATINVEATVSKLRELNTALRALEKQGGLTALARFATDVRAMRTALDSSQASINNITNSMNQMGASAQNNGLKMRTFGDKVRTVMTFRLISEGLIQLKLGITSGIAAIINYDQALKDLQAITKATDIEVSQMGAKILEVASTTKFSAEEVAAGMRTLGQAGFTASEAVLTMQAVADLSTGTLSDMSMTVDLVTTAMRVFQIEASKSQEVVDVFANAVNRSKLTVEKLRTALNYVGPIANDANVSFQELSAAMMTLANSGIRASTIGTSLRQVLSQLVAPSKKFKDAAKDAGVAMEDLDPSTKGFSSVLANLKLVLQDTGTAFNIFGKRGASAALALTAAGSQYNDLLRTVTQTGSAAEMAAKQIEGLGLAFKNLQDKLGILAIALGKGGVATALKLFVDLARGLVDVLIILTDTTLGRTIVAFTTLVTVLGLVIGSVVALKLAFAGSAIAVFISKVALATGGLMGLAGASLYASAALATVLSVITLIAAAGYGIYRILSDGSAEAAEEATILADKYAALEKRVIDYYVATVNMEKGTKELQDASLRLRAELVEVAKGNDKVATKAQLAYEKIHPLTGEFLDQGEALAEYQEVINEFKTEELINALDAAGEALDRQTEKWRVFGWTMLQAIGVPFEFTVAWLKSLVELGNFTPGEIPGHWAKAWKDASGTVASIFSDLDLSKRLREGTMSYAELREEVAKFANSSKPMTKLQKEMKKDFDLLTGATQKYIQELQSEGEINMLDTVDYIKQLGEEAGLTGIKLDAFVSNFKQKQDDLKAGGYFDNIIEKWAKSDSGGLSFLTKNLTEYETAIGKTLDEETKKRLALHEANRQGHINDLNVLKDTVSEAKKSGQDMNTFWKNYAVKEDLILQDAEKSRKALAEDRLAQQKLAYDKEKELLEKQLAENNQKYITNAEKRYKEEARLKTESAKRMEKIISGPLEDPEEQTKLYQKTLKEREAAHAAYIAAIKKAETNKDITIEESQRRQNRAELSFYATSLANAKNYLAQIKKEDDEDEYEKRYEIVLATEKKYHEQRGKFAQESADLLEELNKKELEGHISLAEKKFKEVLKRQKEENDSLEKTMKAYYEDETLYLENYYNDRRQLAEEDAETQKKLLVTRSDERLKELDALISLSNSEKEITGLKNQKLEEEINLKIVLNKVDNDRIQLLESLNRQEAKDLERAQKRIDRLSETITKNREQAQLKNGQLNLEEQFQLELNAVIRRHEQERQELVKNARNVDEAELLAKAARAEQEIEIENLVAANEQKVYEIRLAAAAEFSGNIAAAMQGFYDSGLIQSKKFFQVSKAFAIAEASINAYAAAQTAYKKAMETYSGPAAIVMANIARATALAIGLANIAKIAAQQPPGYAKGGLIEGYSAHKKADNVPIRATAGEYMQPVDAVKYYGVRTMNAIRKLQIPKEALVNLISGTTGLGHPIPSFALASGGSVPSGSSSSMDMSKVIKALEKSGSDKKQPINIMNVTDTRLIGQYLASPEGTNVLFNVMSANGGTIKRLLR